MWRHQSPLNMAMPPSTGCLRRDGVRGRARRCRRCRRRGSHAAGCCVCGEWAASGGGVRGHCRGCAHHLCVPACVHPADCSFSTDVFFPAVSLFTSATQATPAATTFNFGPTFSFPVPRFEGLPEPQPLSILGVAASADDDAAAEAPDAPDAAVGDDVQAAPAMEEPVLGCDS